MHIFFVGEEIPYDGLSGSNITGLCIVQYLLNAGHEITAFVNPLNIEPENLWEKMIEALEDLGVRVIPIGDIRIERPIRSKWDRLFRPQIEDYYPIVRYAPEIKAIIEEHIARDRPHIIFAFGIVAIACTYNIQGLPKFAPICEHIFNFLACRWRYNIGGFRNHYRSLFWLFNSWRVSKQSAKLQAKMEGCGQYAPEYVADFRKYGSTNCKKYNMPVIDHVGKDWRSLKDQTRENNEMFKIIMVGASNTFTLIQLHVLKDILPVLDEKRKSLPFEIHLIGDITLPPELSELQSCSFVKLRGYVEDIEFEFQSCDLLLVPTPFTAGQRSRIMTGLSYGCCVVTTVQEQKTTPELAHLHNVLVANNKLEIVDLIELALTDEALRQNVESNARATYEANFAPEIAVGQLEKDMLEIVQKYEYSRLN